MGSAILEKPSRKLLSNRWVAWIALQWAEPIPYRESQQDRLIGPLPESHRMTFQEAREFFRRMPTPTYEEMLAQMRRNKEQLARMEKEKERRESP